MTVLQDTAQESWDEQVDAATDPLAALSGTERQQAEDLHKESNEARTAIQIAVVLGSSFLFYRLYMARRLRRELHPSITGVALGIATDYYWRQFMPAWIWITAPALVNGAAAGFVDAHTGDVPPEVLGALGDTYATQLGEYINSTSSDALVEGFSSMVNKRLPRRMAAEKAVEAIGLSPRQMRAVNALKTPPPVNSIIERDPDIARISYIDKALSTRAFEIGDNEAYAVTQQGKQLGWMYLQKHHRIPENATRMWVTARDERVCKLCGPMHRKIAPVNKPFDTPLGPMWAPSMHPKCRCTMHLKVPVSREIRALAGISKAFSGNERHEFNRKHPRGAGGRFRDVPDAPVKNAFLDPLVEDMVGRIDRETLQPEISLKDRISLGQEAISLAGGISLNPQLSLSSQNTTIGGISVPRLGIPENTIGDEKISLGPAVGLDGEKIKVPDRGATKRLKHDIFYFDAEGILFPSSDQIMSPDGKTAVLYKQHDLYNDSTIEEQQNVAYSRVVDDVVRAKLASGEYPSVGPKAMRDAAVAEIFGWHNNDLRSFAMDLNIDRNAFVSNVYILNETYADAKEENGIFQAPGPYVVEHVGAVPTGGLPVRRIDIRPMTKEEYEEWELYHQHP